MADAPKTAPVVTFKLRPAERERLREVAEAAGVGPSTYAADTVRQALGTARQRPAPTRSGEVAKAVREATGAIGQVGNNLNQIARRSNQGEPAQAAELVAIREALALIDAHLERVARA